MWVILGEGVDVVHHEGGGGGGMVVHEGVSLDLSWLACWLYTG